LVLLFGPGNLLIFCRCASRLGAASRSWDTPTSCALGYLVAQILWHYAQRCVQKPAGSTRKFWRYALIMRCKPDQIKSPKPLPLTLADGALRRRLSPLK